MFCYFESLDVDVKIVKIFINKIYINLQLFKFFVFDIFDVCMYICVWVCVVIRKMRKLWGRSYFWQMSFFFFVVFIGYCIGCSLKDIVLFGYSIVLFYWLMFIQIVVLMN